MTSTEESTINQSNLSKSLTLTAQHLNLLLEETTTEAQQLWTTASTPSMTSTEESTINQSNLSKSLTLTAQHLNLLLEETTTEAQQLWTTASTPSLTSPSRSTISQINILATFLRKKKFHTLYFKLVCRRSSY